MPRTSTAFNQITGIPSASETVLCLPCAREDGVESKWSNGDKKLNTREKCNHCRFPTSGRVPAGTVEIYTHRDEEEPRDEE